MSNKLALIAKDFPPEKVDLIKRTVAPNATDDELALFLYQAQRTGLDPLARQIVFNKFNTNDGPKMSIITSIDGYRLMADRTGKYAGNDDPIFEGEPIPTKASVTVYKLAGGLRCPFTATARWSEYYPGDKKGFMWRKMPYLMLGKCAEALALRKAFPAELSGIYTDTEMEQAQSDVIIDQEPRIIDQPKVEQPKQESKPVQPEKPKNGNGHGKKPDHPSVKFWRDARGIQGMTDERIRAALAQAGNDYDVALDMLSGVAQDSLGFEADEPGPNNYNLEN